MFHNEQHFSFKHLLPLIGLSLCLVLLILLGGLFFYQEKSSRSQLEKSLLASKTVYSCLPCWPIPEHSELDDKIREAFSGLEIISKGLTFDIVAIAFFLLVIFFDPNSEISGGATENAPTRPSRSKSKKNNANKNTYQKPLLFREVISTIVFACYMIMKKINKIVGDLLKWILRSKGIYTTDQFSNVSYSQFGEDLVLQKIFLDKSDGFYVDVGAFHPKYYSNTYLLYLKGWKGINIDAMPGSMEEFKRIRPRDINLESPVGLKKQTLTYYNFVEKAFNGFFTALPKNVPSKLIDTKKLTTVPLREILDQYVPENQDIDLLSVDVEWMDLDALQSINWNKYKPSVIVVEELHLTVGNPQKSDIHTFLKDKGYILYACIPPSLIFTHTSKIKVAVGH